MRTLVEKTSEFYQSAASSVGFFSMAPIYYSCGGDSRNRDKFYYYCCWSFCYCVVIPGVAAAEAVTCALALTALAVMGVTAPFAFAGAAALDCCIGEPEPQDYHPHLPVSMRHDDVLNLAERGEVRHEELPQQVVKAPKSREMLPADLIRQYFYENMIDQARHCLIRGWWTKETFEDQEPEIMLTLPALVIVQALAISVHSTHFVLQDGTRLRATNVPHQLWDLMGEMLAAKRSVAKLTAPQIELLREKCFKTNSQNQFEISPELEKLDSDEINNLLFTINSIATRITQRVQCQQRLPEIIDAVLAEAGAYDTGYHSC